MSTKKSTIPPKAQLPVAIVMGALLILLVMQRTGVVQRIQALRVEEKTASVAESTVSIDDVLALIGEASPYATMAAAVSTDMEPLPRDPFSMPAWQRARMARNVEPGEGPDNVRPGFDRNTARGNTLAAMRLTATVLTGENAGALIDGEYVSLGDEIGGFKVVFIGERQVTLEDALGMATLEIPREGIE